MTKRRPWTIERLVNCGTISRTQLKKVYGDAAFRAAKRLGVLDKLFPPREGVKVKWTVETIWYETFKYTSYSSFVGSACYSKMISRYPELRDPIKADFILRDLLVLCRESKYIKDIPTSLRSKAGRYGFSFIWKPLKIKRRVKKRPYKKKSTKKLMKLTKKYKTLTNLRIKNKKLYAECKRREITEFKYFKSTKELQREASIKCAVRSIFYGNKKAILKEASKYKRMSEFRYKCVTAYYHMKKLNLYDKVAAKMEKPKSHMDNDCVYVWEVVGHYGLCGSKIYKIGVTSWRLGHRRINKVAAELGAEAKIIRRVKVDNGLAFEKELLTYGYDAGFTDVDGYTEFRIIKWWEFENMLEYIDSEIVKRKDI